MTFLEENVRINICDLELDNSFLHITSKVQRKKDKLSRRKTFQRTSSRK